MSSAALPSGVFIPEMMSGGNTSVQTNATGATFNAFPGQVCKQLTIANNTGSDVEVQDSGTGDALPVFNGTYYTFFGLGNANQLAVRRVDQSATQVTVKARWEV